MLRQRKNSMVVGLINSAYSTRHFADQNFMKYPERMNQVQPSTYLQIYDPYVFQRNSKRRQVLRHIRFESTTCIDAKEFHWQFLYRMYLRIEQKDHVTLPLRQGVFSRKIQIYSTLFYNIKHVFNIKIQLHTLKYVQQSCTINYASKMSFTPSKKKDLYIIAMLIF